MRDNFSINQMKGCSLMKHDYPDYLRDMNHDGDIDSHDFALYHEMMDEDERGSSANAPTFSNYPWGRYEWKEFFINWLIMVLFGAPAGALLNGSIPANFFTGLLSLVCTPIGVKKFFDILDMM